MPGVPVESVNVVPDGEDWEAFIFLTPHKDLSAIRIFFHRTHDPVTQTFACENSSTNSSEQCQLIYHASPKRKPPVPGETEGFHMKVGVSKY